GAGAGHGAGPRPPRRRAAAPHGELHRPLVVVPGVRRDGAIRPGGACYSGGREGQAPLRRNGEREGRSLPPRRTLTMCGITGWISRNPAAPVEEETLRRMRDAIRHRGPDGEGLWISPDRRVGLGSRRLAIVDLSEAANQPMINEDGSVRIVYNGEIYNHRRVRAELEARSHRFRTAHHDTESVVHGYGVWGQDVVHPLEGMFTFAIWDARQKRLFLARDRIGIKPLYFAWTPSGFFFGSEIKALLSHPAVPADIEPTS